VLLLREYTLVAPKWSLGRPELPIEFALDGGRSVQIRVSENDELWHMSVTEPINVADLRLVPDSGWRRKDQDGDEHPVPSIEVVSEAVAETAVLARSIASAMSYLLDKPVRFSVRPHDDEFIPETSEDEATLDAWGTRSVFTRLSVSTSGGSVTGRVNGDDILAVLPQQAGLRLYEEALRADTSTARFRDLWRVLESAFASQDQALVDLLASFEPLKTTGVDAAELKQLLVLRGRASHAQSKAGLREVTHVEHECGSQNARLKTLVERVIATKATWGYPTTGYQDRLKPGRRVADTERIAERGGEIRLG
jgi:hypothetical protein